jgi:importin-5
LQNNRLALENVQNYWRSSCSALLEVIYDEPDTETLVQFLMAFYDCVNFMGNLCMMIPYKAKGSDTEEPMLMFFAKVVLEKLSEVFQRIEARNRKRNDKDLYDQDLEEALQEEEEMEDDVLGQLSRNVHIVCRTNGANFLPCFKEILHQPLAGMLSSEPSETNFVFSQAKQWAICVVDDIIEFCGAEAAFELRSSFLDSFLKSLMEEKYPDIRQATAYGFGTLAYQVSLLKSDLAAQWFPLMKNIFQACVVSMQQPWSRSEDHSVSSENVVSALGKLIHYILEPSLSSGSISPEEFAEAVRLWITMLPIVEDEEETSHTYGYLLELLERNDPSVSANLLHVYSVLTKAVANGIVSRGTVCWPNYKTGLELHYSILAKLKSTLPLLGEQAVQHIWNYLDREEQARIQVLFDQNKTTA